MTNASEVKKTPKTAKKPSLTLASVGQVFRAAPWLAAALAAVIAAGAVLSLMPAQMLKAMIDSCLVPRSAAGLLGYALAYLGYTAASAACDFLRGVLFTVLGQKLVRELRRELKLKFERVGAQYYTSHTSGEITSYFLNDVGNVSSLFSDGLLGMVSDCFKIIGIIVSIWLFSSALGLIALAAVPVIALITRAFQRRMLAAQVENLKQLGAVNAHISESLRNAPMILQFGAEGHMEERYRGRLEENFRTLDRVNLYDSLYSPVIQVLRAAVISAIVMLVSRRFGLSVGISLGSAAASIEYMSNLFAPIEALGTELQEIQKGLSGVSRVDELGALPEAPAKDPACTASSIMAAGAELVFDHVCFSYESEGGNAAAEVLSDISLAIPARSKVTFAGRTGVGKTTLFNLITGLLSPTSGKLTLGGCETRRIPDRERRRLFGYVEQSFSAVPGTIADQISLSDPAVTRAQVEHAAALVGLDGHIRGLDGGYDRAMNDADFSQGQKQLLSIARAVAADPPILLLDEITANLDSATETALMAALDAAQRDRTVLSVSHRLGVTARGTTIVTLKDGRVESVQAAK